MYTEYLGPLLNNHDSKKEFFLERAARLLQQGNIIAVPTETTYGLAASVLSEKGINRLYQIKRRPKTKPLPVHLSNLDQLKFIVSTPPPAFKVLSETFLPGPLTLVLEKKPCFSSCATSRKNSIGIRISSHPFVKRLIELSGCPLAISSANLSNYPCAISAHHVLEDFDGKIEAILDGGDSQYGLESTVVSLEDPHRVVLLRYGMISHSQIEKALGYPIFIDQKALFCSRNEMENQGFPIVRLFSSLDEIQIYLQLSSYNRRLIFGKHLSVSSIRECDVFKLTKQNFFEGLRFAIKKKYIEILVVCDGSLKEDEALYRKLKQIASP